ncbi:SDR family oxidoreductase [Gilvimarinus agarilyticus]|uniref:SDR family oxidoreductase n=1 Tax=unclassified Gilvimarinus TaxID=2642066 RepID=UPI001C098FC7|nr:MULTISPECIES: SDR family oxidoreductase [unclassified Gilvimarinus]MBU2885223.1 SDR family oxidoreductase [Gilvimarinus agarilyticus]MDO6570120.1 SDR family oxidoreductase [Gilvimarinus sp. 2_MG-2023]MDO6748292.1 SDR family oxidoreductase [Gilvimarinus sp. 1_MG-2023]
MSTLIIGAGGQIGRLLTRDLCQAGDEVRAMVRTPNPELQTLGAEVCISDLEQDFSHLFNGCQKVVFSAGSGAKTGADKTILVDLWGAIKAIDYAAQAGVKHFVMISSRGAENPDKGPAAIKHYAVCKKLADDHLIRSQLPFTILRPGRLLNEPARGTISTTLPTDPEQQVITRADVAAVAAFCLQNTSAQNAIYPLVNGEQTLSDAFLSEPDN